MKRALIGSFVLWCAVTGAAQAQTRVVVFDFEGPRDAVQIRKAVVDVLEDNAVEVVSTKTALAQARRSGAELDTESGRVRVGKKLRLTAFVEGRVEHGKRGAVRVNLAVYGARDGLVAGQMSVSAPKRKVSGELKATLWDQLGDAVRGATESAKTEPEPLAEEEPPPPPQRQVRQQPAQRQPVQREDEDEEEVAQAEPSEEEQEAPGEEKPSAGPKVNALDINLGARFGTRDYVYNDPLPGVLNPYDMSVSPNLRLALRWYPVAHFSDSALSNIGLDLRGEMLVGVTSKNRLGQKFETSAHSLGVGVRGRLPFRSFELGAVLGYGLHAFSLTSTSKADPKVPNASYGFVRAGLDARWQFADPFYFAAQAAYLIVLSHGQIEDREWFPHTSGDGVEADLALGYNISNLIAVEAGFALQRFFMTFDPLPNDRSVREGRRVAGGAVDQYVSGRVAMVIRL